MRLLLRLAAVALLIEMRHAPYMVLAGALFALGMGVARALGTTRGGRLNAR